MKFLEDTLLAHYDTMKIGGNARYIAAAETEQDIVEAFNFCKENQLKLQVIGDGSNIIFTDAGFDGLVVINRIPGLLIDSYSNQMRLGSGTSWHEAVVKSVEAGLCGIEAMALIPGTCGAAPINNIGAYGQELKDVLLNLSAFDTTTGRFEILQNADCHFNYRDSIFKSEHYGRYIITSITLQLSPTPELYEPPKYPSLQNELNSSGITYPTPEQVMQSVMRIRMSKLPNPAVLANTGSFFKNPIVNTEQLNILLKQYPEMPHYPQNNATEKLSAGWLIEQVGLKGYHQNGMQVYNKQALVLVNESAQSFADLESMKNTIVSKVKEQFGVSLEIEPEII